MEVKEGLKYSKDHEWVRIEEEFAFIGVTDYAQGELGEIVYVEVDTVGESLTHKDIFGTIEAVKTTSDLFMPVSGEVIEFNAQLDENEGDQPDLINSDPFGEGWIIKIKLADDADLSHLMDAEAYKEIIS